MKLKTIALLLVLCLCFSMLAACGSTGTSSDSTSQPAAESQTTTEGATQVSAADGTLSWLIMSDPVALDPIYAYDDITNLIENQIVEGLLTFDDNNGIVPLLCSSWECKDSTTYVYEIRSDVTFSDGSPMTMEDVLFSLERNYADGSDSYVGWMYGSVESIEQTGDWELTVHLSAADATWQYTFATTAGHVISKAYYEANAETFGTSSGSIVGTGPYVLDHWTNGSEVVLTKNETYWNAAETTLMYDTIVYNVIVEDTTRIQAMATAQGQYMLNTPTDMMDQIASSENAEIVTIDTFGIDFLAFNTQRAPFDDVNVRRAIACAIDTTSLKDAYRTDVASYTTGLPLSSALYTVGDTAEWESYASSAKPCTYDMEQAKAYLAQSAYADGFTCRLLVNELSTNNSYALYIQAALAELGITVNIEKCTNDELITMQFGGTMDAEGLKDYDMGLFVWYADYPDTAGNLNPIFLSTNGGEGGSNTSSYNNPEVDSLLIAQSQSTDASERQKLMEQAMDIIMDEVPIFILDYPKMVISQNKGIENTCLNASYVWNLYAKNFAAK